MSQDRREDETLQAVFAEAHRETHENTPPFATMWQNSLTARPSRDRPRRRHFLAALTAAAASLVVAAGLIGIRGLNEPEAKAVASDAEISEMATSLSEWQAPLDFLLQTPGSEWLETTPRLAGSSTPLLDLSFLKETRE